MASVFQNRESLCGAVCGREQKRARVKEAGREGSSQEDEG